MAYYPALGLDASRVLQMLVLVLVIMVLPLIIGLHSWLDFGHETSQKRWTMIANSTLHADNYRLPRNIRG
jgi:hypothetical protein